MLNAELFDRRYGKGAFDRLRSMLDDPSFAYQQVANEIGLTRQRIARIATDLGFNGRHRQQERVLHREPRVVKEFKQYAPRIEAVVEKLKGAGLDVMPYNMRQPALANHLQPTRRMILVNGVLCTVQVRSARKIDHRYYARLYVGRDVKRTRALVFAIRRGRMMKIYVLPTSQLPNVSVVYVPANGKYAVGSSKKPRKDWTRYEGAWHLLDGART